MDDYYYVYEDDQNDLYYYSAKTKESTYIKPINKIFLDPETNETYDFNSKKTKTEDKSEDDHHQIEKTEKVYKSKSEPVFIQKKEKEPEEEKSEKESFPSVNDNYYFVYKTPENILYYYNCSTQETTYTKPINAKFFDPNTKLPYEFDESNQKPKKNKRVKFSDMDEKQAHIIHGRPRRNDIIPAHNTANSRSSSPNLLF